MAIECLTPFYYNISNIRNNEKLELIVYYINDAPIKEKITF